MRNVIKYIILFAVLILLQVFLFDNLNLSMYIYPLIYTGFILLLPMNIDKAALLFLSLFTGICVDLLSGTAGLHTIACLASGFLRPMVMNATIGKDLSKEGYMPLPFWVGRGKWLKYITLTISIHCIIFFFFEVMSLSYFLFTFLRTLGSIISTILLIWFIAWLIPTGQRNSSMRL